MANLILEIEKIQDYIRKGYPEGVEPILRSLPFLFNRIEELEMALVPFGRVGARPNYGKELSEVYYKDCQRAYLKLSSKAAKEAAPSQQEWLPAE